MPKMVPSQARVLAGIDLGGTQVRVVFGNAKGDILSGARTQTKALGTPARVVGWIGAQARRHEVRPGLTGWAQVNGRDELEIPAKAALDGEYVRRAGFFFDIKIFFKTVGKVFKSDGVVEGGTGNNGKLKMENGKLESGEQDIVNSEQGTINSEQSDDSI